MWYAPSGIDHQYMVRNYQISMRAIGRGLRPLQRRGHMAEHIDDDARRKRLEVELPTPTQVVSCSPSLRCRPHDLTRASR